MVGCLEGMAATTARNGIGIVHGKSGAHESVDIVDLRAFEIPNAVLVDDNPNTVTLEYFVAILNRSIEGHSVLKPGTATGRYEDTQSGRRVGLLLDKLLELIGRVRCQRDHP